MYLKRIELQGFKSFVDKTVLEFEKGITAIVGPNGSGKSNVSDALKWVMGEQSPKELRGGKMEDVIFAGTENRKAVGFAEVSVTFNNEDGVLDIEYSEVKVTRRLYRSGLSEYAINGASCRLKDIVVLFADTGIGRDGYSVIGQGRVDEVLRNKSEDRRNIFEDAAGIMKYRIKKLDSERKLSATEQNLLRINDIITELEYQMKTLEKQSETAKAYLQLKYELRDIEVGVLVDSIKKIDNDLEGINESIDRFSVQLHENESELERIKNENTDKTEAVSILGEEIETVRNNIYDTDKRCNKYASDIALNNEKIQSANDNISRLNNDIAQSEGRIEQKMVQIDQIKENKAELSAKRKILLREITEKQEDFNNTAGSIKIGEDEINRVRQEVLNKMMEKTQKSGAINSLTQQIQLLERRKKEIEEQISKCSEDSVEAEVEFEEVEAKHAELKGVLKKAEEALNATGSDIEELKKQLDKNIYDYNTANGELQSKNIRLRLMKEMEAGYEGYAKSVKEILTICRENKNFGKGIYGAVAQLLTVPEKYEMAIETALGAAYQNIVTQTEDEAKQAIDYLKRKQLGRATFLPLSAISGRVMEDNTKRKLKSFPGFLGIAGDLISYDKKFALVVSNLLGRVAVFDNIDHAINVAREFGYDFICVTLDGDILRTSGAITGGSPDKKHSGTLARTREIPELQKDIEVISKKVEKLGTQVKQTEKDIMEAENQKASAYEQIRISSSQYASVEAKCNSLAERINNSKEQILRLQKDLFAQNGYILQAQETVSQFEQDLQVISKEALELQSTAEAYEKQSKTFNEKKDIVNKELIRLQLSEGEARNSIDRLNDDQNRLQKEIDTSREHILYMRIQIKENSDVIDSINSENNGFTRQLEADKLLLDEFNRKLAELTEKKRILDSTLGGMLDKVTEINGKVSALVEDINKLSLIKVKLETETETHKNRLWEAYELTPSAAAELVGNYVVENPVASMKQINLLRGKIKALGPVNVNSIEEYENTSKRYNYMTAQKKDMDEGKAKLQKVINEVTSVMRKQFSEQFAVIRKNFSEVFSELFGGGSADITLGEGDVLDCGIEIQVQPPGKKLQNMLLLSGGERALTAIALLFGIMKMRPSPFYLLDEIESALDEANVIRLADYLKKAVGDMQFVMVTHRKGTMEAASSLYGVTMEEKGVSRVVSIKV